MLTIGFTNHYYTLWNVTSGIRYGAGSIINGSFTGESFHVTSYTYYQNLSMDFESAKAKIEKMAGESGYEIDLDLRGSGSFEKTVRQINLMADWQFTFGKLTGSDIRICDDVWQLKRAMKEEIGGRRKLIARKRLIELGELVRYDWVESVWSDTKYYEVCEEYLKREIYSSDIPQEAFDGCRTNVNRKYATKRQAEYLENQKNENKLSGHFYNEGERITLKIKRIGGFSFDGSYGTTFIEKYLTEDGNMVKYMGGSLPDISSEEFVTVKATIKHDNYKGQDETKLQRIKISK